MAWSNLEEDDSKLLDFQVSPQPQPMDVLEMWIPEEALSKIKTFLWLIQWLSQQKLTKYFP